MHSKITLFILGYCFYLSLHYIFCQIVLHLFKRNETDAYVISCRVVSAIQAIIAVTVGVIIATSCQDIMKDVLTVQLTGQWIAKLKDLVQVSLKHWLTNTYLYFGFPYFLYDTWAMYAYNIRLHSQHYTHLNTHERIKRFVLTNKLMVIHHIFLPGVLLPLILMYRNDRGDFFMGVFYMIEIVVPLMSAREILIQLDLKRTRLYVVNSVLVIIVFFVCRILVFPYLYHAYANHAHIPLWAVPSAIPLKCNFSCLAILAPQIYWFSLMIRMLRRAITGRSSHVHAEKNTDSNSNSFTTNGTKLK